MASWMLEVETKVFTSLTVPDVLREKEGGCLNEKWPHGHRYLNS